VFAQVDQACRPTTIVRSAPATPGCRSARL
jgi:hypothetical protein